MTLAMHVYAFPPCACIHCVRYRYCDVMTLAMVDLHLLSSQNNLWTRLVSSPGPGAAAGKRACRVQGTGSMSIASIAGLRRRAAKLKAHHRPSPKVKPSVVADETASRSGASSPNSGVSGRAQACSLRTASVLSESSHPVLSPMGTQLGEP